MNKTAILLLAALVLALAASVGQSQENESSSGNEQLDKERILEEVEVDESRAGLRQGILNRPVGRVEFEPLPVRMNGSPPILSHSNIELVLRPVRLGDNGLYVPDDSVGIDFEKVNVELLIGASRTGSRLPVAKDGRRSVVLPEGIYALTEVRYSVFNRIGRFADADQLAAPGFAQDNISPFDVRYCLSERSIAIDIKEDEVTELGRLVIRALERNYRSSERQHRPLLGADVPFVQISDPAFRNKAPETSAAAVIAFDSDSGLCRETSQRVPGWFTPEELAEALPSFESKLSSQDG